MGTMARMNFSRYDQSVFISPNKKKDMYENLLEVYVLRVASVSKMLAKSPPTGEWVDFIVCAHIWWHPSLQCFGVSYGKHAKFLP